MLDGGARWGRHVATCRMWWIMMARATRVVVMPELYSWVRVLRTRGVWYHGEALERGECFTAVTCAVVMQLSS